MNKQSQKLSNKLYYKCEGNYVYLSCFNAQTTEPILIKFSIGKTLHYRKRPFFIVF